MLLNPKGNSFYFNYPKGFFSPNVTEKYESYIKKQPIPFDNVDQFVNSTIQSIGFPSLTADTVEQVRNLGKRVNYKSSTPVQDLFNKDFSISFKAVDGFVNYFIMLETALHFLNFKNPNQFIDVLPLRIMDNEGNIVFSVTFKEVLFSGVGEISLNYTANNPSVTTFDVGFRCNYLDIQFELK
jgi:hypothetical protein